MLKVISFKICPFVQRVTAMLEAKKIPYEIDYISLNDKPSWFIEISPNSQVPILLTESGTALFESDAIIEYIEDQYDPIEKNLSAEEKALDRAWSYQASKNYLAQCSTMRSGDKKTLIEREEKLSKVFAKAEKAIIDGPFFKGDKVSKVDIAWLPLLHRAAIIEKNTCHDFLKNFPKVKQWQQSLQNTGLFSKSVSVDFEDKFTNFYLSDKTFLGKGTDCEGVEDGDCNSRSCC